jgi:hypothetical protein
VHDSSLSLSVLAQSFMRAIPEFDKGEFAVSECRAGDGFHHSDTQNTEEINKGKKGKKGNRELGEEGIRARSLLSQVFRLSVSSLSSLKPQSEKIMQQIASIHLPLLRRGPG